MEGHILFIHSSVNGHLGCFHCLALVMNAARNVGAQISVQVPAFNSSGYIYSEVELLSHMSILSLKMECYF